MKNAILALPLLLASPACSTMRELVDVPAAVISDVGGAVEAVTPGETAAAEAAGTVASTGVSIATGNPALGAAAGALVTGIAAFFISRRKKPAA